MDKQLKIKHATGFIRWYLITFGYVAIVNPFNKVCYAIKPLSPALIRHELMHVEQIERHESVFGKFGRLTFAVWYVLLLMRHGYYNHPYEVEARMAEAT